MSWTYAFTPYIWPMLACAVIAAGVSGYSLHWRSKPGALALALTCFFGFTWALGSVLEMAGADAPTRIFWSEFQAAFKLATATAELCFVLEYADPGRWLNRRTLALLSFPVLLTLLLIVTNDTHHLVFTGFTAEPYPQPIKGIGNLVITSYSFLLVGLQMVLLVWLAVRSPRHRWPVALILLGQTGARAAFLVDVMNASPVAPMDLAIIFAAVLFILYGLTLSRFHLFDLIPVARETGIEQMETGLVVMDAQRRLVDLNAAAEKILGVSARFLRGKTIHALPFSSELDHQLDDRQGAACEFVIGSGAQVRYYASHLTRLTDRRGVLLGHNILLYDVTEQKRAQAQIVEQQSALATMAERERLARELHDNIGQTIGFMNAQAQAAREYLARGEPGTVDSYLARLVDVAQNADADIRESIMALRSTAMLEQGLVPALDKYLRQFGTTYELSTDLSAAGELQDLTLGTTVELDLLRIIQEALANARKHAHAHGVTVRLAIQGRCLETVVEDDGDGFDVAAATGERRQKFGLQLMRERAQQAGGSVTIDSGAGQGTRVRIAIPLTSSPSPRRDAHAGLTRG